MKRREWLEKSLLSSTGALLGSKLVLPVFQDEELDEILRLHWNENPFGPSEKVVKAVQEAVPLGNLYWDEKSETIKSKLASLQGLRPDHYLMTSGSTEVLSLLGQHVGLQGGEIIMGAQSFPTIGIFGDRCGAQIKKIIMDGYYLSLDQMIDAIGDNTKLIFICNPNNPTSTELDRELLVDFCRNVPEDVLICVDEAYIEFSKQGITSSLVDLVQDLPNLIIARTFSKAYGLAGFRLGYAISQPQNIKALMMRYPALGMAPGLLPYVAGIAALEDQDFVNHVVKEINTGKQLMQNAFENWDVTSPESATNFLYVHKERFVDDVQSKLADEKIWITQWPSMKDHIRISIGRPEWMSTLVDKLEGLRA